MGSVLEDRVKATINRVNELYRIIDDYHMWWVMFYNYGNSSIVDVLGDVVCTQLENIELWLQKLKEDLEIILSELNSGEFDESI